MSGVQRLTGTDFAVALTTVARRVQGGAATQTQEPLPFDSVIGTTYTCQRILECGHVTGVWSVAHMIASSRTNHDCNLNTWLY